MAVRAYPVSASGQVGPQNPAGTAPPVQGATRNEGGFVKLMGWSLRETGGTSAVGMTITDGGVSGGTKQGEVYVAANGSSYAWFGPEGVEVSIGCYVTTDGSGTLSGVLYIR